MSNPDASADFDVMTIEEFCRRHKFSTGFYFQQARLGKMPRVLRVGRRTLIPHEAIAEWRKAMETDAARSRLTTRGGEAIATRQTRDAVAARSHQRDY